MMDVRRATVAGGRLRVEFDGLKAWRDSLSGHATSEPLLRYLPKAELVLKRAIPALIVAFLSVVAASHFFGMMSEYGRLEASARHATALSAATASAVFADAADIFDSGDISGAQARL
ncbi:PAS domain-containing sensor histidine kinase, partial [Rhizobium ruizarguesonis]